MQTFTYRQAYDKIIEAYFKDEIQPLNAEFCFCGTLSPDSFWARSNVPSSVDYPYSYLEYGKMEKALFIPFGYSQRSPGSINTHTKNGLSSDELVLVEGYEDKLFKGMCAALDVLKEIHRSRGENVDEKIPAFTKRELKPVV